MSQREYDKLTGIFGPVQVIERLAIGECTAVYKAVRLDGGEEVALKVLDPSSGEVAQIRFEVEGRLGGYFDHPNLLKIKQVGEAEGLQYQVHEMVQDTIDRRLRAQGPPPWKAGAQIIGLVCEGLAHLHAASIVHRDIRPANIFQIGRTLKLGGLETALQVGYPVNCEPGRKPAYMCPELFIDPDNADISGDTYSLAATLWEMITGKTPYAAEDMSREALRKRHQESPVPDINAALPGTPPVLAEFFKRALDKHPARRYQTVEQFREDLTNIAAGKITELPEIVRPLSPAFETTLESPQDDSDSGSVSFGAFSSGRKPGKSRADLSQRSTDSTIRHVPSQRRPRAVAAVTPSKPKLQIEVGQAGKLLGVIGTIVFSIVYIISSIPPSSAVIVTIPCVTTEQAPLHDMRFEMTGKAIPPNSEVKVQYLCKRGEEGWYFVEWTDKKGYVPQASVNYPPDAPKPSVLRLRAP